MIANKHANRRGIKSILKITSVSLFALTAMSMETGAFADVGEEQLEALEYRNIGPFRGGRSTAGTGVIGDNNTYYFGGTGSGVWKTTNRGITWDNISDGSFGVGSIGAIAVSASDPNVVIVGTGAAPVRGVASSHGDGVYKSTDAGKTWKHIGLPNSRQVASVKIHPTNPDIIYVTAQGSPYKPGPDRGVYRTKNGGETWDKVLFVDETTAAIDLKMDSNNPRILYASMWDTQREPWNIRSGGQGSGLHKSTDGGDTWEKIDEDLPELKGKMGITVSPANSERLWAIVEAKEKGGLWRSDDSGESWTHVNGDRRLHARSWYYMHIFADPNDENTVYVMNSGMYKSIDGGKSVSSIRGTHGDFHNLWINPDDSNNMIVSNDGGGAVTINGGNFWTTQHNQPTAQFYRVNVDNDYPYRVYSGQQDNSAIGVLSRGLDGRIGEDDYFSVGGCESAHVAFDPDNPRFSYAGCYLGQIAEYDTKTMQSRDIRAYPELSFGKDPSTRKYRFNWNAPIATSIFDRKVLFHGGNKLLMSSDRGHSWLEVSPDLTKNEIEKQGRMGGPITNEVSENYNTLFAIAESPHEKGTMYAGSDDGLIHITRNMKDWEDITPNWGEEQMVNSIEVSPHDPGTAYAVVTGYKYNDFKPYIYKTENYGKRWRKITNGIPDGAFARVVREDPIRRGLLFAGTETGMYISYDDGKAWQSFQTNLPVVPITDIILRHNDIVLSTQGRAFWVLDDMTPLRTMEDDVMLEPVHLFEPTPHTELQLNGSRHGGEISNPSGDAQLYYSIGTELAEDAELKMEVIASNGEVMTTLTSKDDGLPTKVGLNKFFWDKTYEDFDSADGVKFSYGEDGYQVPYGTYNVRMTLGNNISEGSLTINPDPRSEITMSQWAEHARISREAYDLATELNRSINTLRDARAQIEDTIKREGITDELREAGEAAAKALIDWDESVISDKREFFQDVLNWPDKLFSDVYGIYGILAGSTPPITEGAKERLTDISVEFGKAMVIRDTVLDGAVTNFNKVYSESGLPAILLKSIEKLKDESKPVS
ncbi:MAG: WD40/YVTN/BNR-like repeat-containing protein [Sphingomonadales bacterium]